MLDAYMRQAIIVINEEPFLKHTCLTQYDQLS